MVKRSRVLEAEVEADLPYEETRLARKAGPARKRLAGLLILGAVGFAIEAALARDSLMLFGAAALAAAGWGAWRGSLGGVIAAALVAVLSFLLALAFLATSDAAWGEKIALVLVLVWAALMLPDVLTLVRDQELQYAYGRWARREA